MPGRELARAVYSWASGVAALRRPLDAIRTHPRVRAFARRHVEVLLARGTTWANLDGALRLLAEDPRQRVVFGPWRGDLATELLYWAPFVCWAQQRFSLDPSRVAVVSRDGAGTWYGRTSHLRADAQDFDELVRGAAVFPSEPFLALLELYRSGSAPPRPLLKRLRHARLQPPHAATGGGPSARYVAVELSPSAAFPASAANRRLSESVIAALSASGPIVSLDPERPPDEQHALLAGAAGLVASYSGLALLGALSGVPTVALTSDDGEVVQPDLDLALRVTSALGASLSVVGAAEFEALRDAIGGR
jgi:hypothetical protein